MSEPYRKTLAIIETSIRLRKEDSLPRAVAQAKKWQQTLEAARKRGDAEEEQNVLIVLESLKTVIQKNTGKFTPKKDDVGPTPEMVASPSRRDTIKSLEDAGTITHEHAATARRIRRIVEEVTRCVSPHCQRFERGCGKSVGGSSGFSEDVAHRWSAHYVPWAARMKKEEPLAYVISQAVIINGASLDVARKIARVGYERGRNMLIWAIEGFDDIAESKERQRHTIMNAACSAQR